MSSCSRTGAPAKTIFSVFLSHAGEQKKIFVDHIHTAFRGTGIQVFMDQHELHYGDEAPEEMRRAASEATVGEFCWQPCTTNTYLQPKPPLKAAWCCRGLCPIQGVRHQRMADARASVVLGPQRERQGVSHPNPSLFPAQLQRVRQNSGPVCC